MSTTDDKTNQDGQHEVVAGKDAEDKDKETVKVTLAADPEVDNIPTIVPDADKKLSATKVKAGYSGLAFDLMRADGKPLTGLQELYIFVESKDNGTLRTDLTITHDVAANFLQFIVPFGASTWKDDINNRSEISYTITAKFADNTYAPAAQGSVTPRRSIFAVRTSFLGKKKRRGNR